MSEVNPKDGVTLPIVLESDEHFHFPLANHVVVNHDAGHFYVRFYQVTPPPVWQLEGDGTPDHVKAKLVAGVALPASFMPSLTRVLSENLARYWESTEDETSDSEQDETHD